MNKVISTKTKKGANAPIHVILFATSETNNLSTIKLVVGTIPNNTNKILASLWLMLVNLS